MLRSFAAAKFLIVGLLFVYAGLENLPWGWLLVWFGASFLGVALAYSMGKPGAFGKDGSGRLPWWVWLPFGPHLFFTWLSWQGMRRFGGEACCHQVAPGLWLGRRPYADELPPDVGLVVDLTCEFPRAEGVGLNRTYVCFPVLDGTAIDAERFSRVVDQAAGWKDRAVYIHCAIGHGRSAMVAAAVLIRKGLHADPDEAIRAIQRVRPRVGLSPGQRDGLAAFASRRPVC